MRIVMLWQSAVKGRPLMQDVLLPHEIEWLEKQQHRPNAATQVGRCHRDASFQS